MSIKKKNIQISTNKKKPLRYGLGQVLELRFKSPSLKERLEIYRLDKNYSQTQMIDEMSSALNTSTDNIKKWLSGSSRQIPQEYVEDILKLYNLPSNPTYHERVIYTELLTTYGSIHSIVSKDQKKPNKKLSNTEKEERRKTAADSVTQYDIEQEQASYDDAIRWDNYIPVIFENFTELSPLKKYILCTFFEVYNRIPQMAWEFAKEYSCLNDQGQTLIFDYMKRKFSIIEKQRVTFSQEEKMSLSLFKKMAKFDFYNLKEFPKNTDIDSITDSFSKKLLDLNIPAPAYLEDMVLYSEIETDEWEIILYFIQLGTRYNPCDTTELSPVQQKAFELINILYNEFELGFNIDELSPTGQSEEF